ncbi:lipopolysaccharide biosynthesis protein [Clostridium sp. Marseille-P3244]|uniref:lipopolysaccharide biosynthesis protein n=1 Tax=Clostridium sp. Marseille-P3244 TaxID=1871020 RepID=UPI000931CEE7|nr:oligosaccharide flippase family protein [Clostridium sp. Marseille-P3244]
MGSRSLNSSRNAVSGIIKVIVKIALPFIIRTSLLYYLGKEYLGLNSLFSSILSVLNLAELGFSSAVVYRLYKPFADNDKRTVGAYLGYLKKIYRIIGCIVFGAGIILTPFLPKLINGSYPSDVNLYFLYFLYLLNTSVSYFFSGYKRTLIIAAQRMDYINIIETGLLCLQYIAQIATIVAFRNYVAYIIVMPVATVMVNIAVSLLCQKEYPEYFTKGLLTVEQKKEMASDVKWVSVYRISEVTRNSFDSIVISSIIGLTAVGIYNNYYYIFSALYSFMVIINESLQASIGNSIAKETREKNEDDIYKFSLFSLWIILFCCTGLICFYQPVMTLWMGADMLLPDKDMILFVVYFYVLNMNNIRNLYFNGNGLWKSGAKSYIIESLFNLLLNIVLGRLFGITGVIIATILTMFFCSFIWRSQILFHRYFQKSPKCFYIMHGKMILISSIVLATCLYLCELIGNDGILSFVGRAIICLIIPNIIMLIYLRNNKYFKEGISQISAVFHMIKRKHNP